MTWQKAQAQSTKGGAGRPRFGANEITLSTRVMLSREEEDPRWESQCGHKTFLPGMTSGPPEPHFCPKHRLNLPINTPYSSWQKVSI
jgi:hypothetical protein